MMLDVENRAEALLEFTSPLGARRWKARILSATPGVRMVVQYTLYRGDSQPDREACVSLIGKFYADGQGCHAYRVMQELTATLPRASASALLAVPRALFYDPDRRLLVQQPVPGVPYGELLECRDSPTYFRMAGRALACLHAQALLQGEEKGFGDHLDELIHPHPLRLGDEVCEYRPQIRSLLQAMEERARMHASQVAISPLHRDFHLRQLFSGQGRVWLIDWDLFAKGDPALDVGNFLAYLKTHLRQHWIPSTDAFLEGYFRDRPSPPLERVPLYEAFTYLRLACKRFRLKGDRWKEKTGDMLRLSEKCLWKEGRA